MTNPVETVESHGPLNLASLSVLVTFKPSAVALQSGMKRGQCSGTKSTGASEESSGILGMLNHREVVLLASIQQCVKGLTPTGMEDTQKGRA